MALDSFIQTPPDSTGKKVDNVELVVGANTVQRQRFVVGAIDPKDERLTSVDLGAGVNVDLTTADITTGKTGKLAAADVGASVPLRVDIQTVSGARVTRSTIFTQAGETVRWRTPHLDHLTQAGGAGNGFGVSITNLDTSQAANVYATLYWEEY